MTAGITAWLPTAVNTLLFALLMWFGRRELDSTKKAAEKAEASARSVETKIGEMRETDAKHSAEIEDLRSRIANLQASYESVKKETDRANAAMAARLDAEISKLSERLTELERTT